MNFHRTESGLFLLAWLEDEKCKLLPQRPLDAD